MAHDPAPDPAQFPWTPEGQAAKADFTQWLRDRDKQEFLEHVIAQQNQQNQLLLATAELVREVCGWFHPPSSRTSTIPKPNQEDAEPRRTPQIPAWRTYRGFLNNMLMREEAIIARAKELDTKPNLNKESFAGHTGGDSVKSISRTMEDYGLDVERDWPPSTWPKRAPRTSRPSIDGPALLAAGLFGWAVLDFVSDGRFDNTVRMVRFVGCHVGLPL